MQLTWRKLYSLQEQHLLRLGFSRPALLLALRVKRTYQETTIPRSMEPGMLASICDASGCDGCFRNGVLPQHWHVSSRNEALDAFYRERSRRTRKPGR